MASARPRPAAFLDRDGTLNAKAPPHEYITSLDRFEWIPGAVEGAVALARAGFVLAVVSNQRGIARGLLTSATLGEIENEIQSALAPHGVRVESFRYCPHELDAGCDCRKPRPGMLIDVANELHVDLPNSWMIGDSETDVEAGRAAGTHTARITTDAGTSTADLTAPTLLDAVRKLAR